MEVLDISTWEKDEDIYVSGSRKKFWFTKPGSEQKYLFKFPLKNTGEAWAEIVAARIGEHLGLTMSKMTLARFEGTVGVLSENFRSLDEEFFAGGDLFLEFCPDFDRESLDHYHVDMLFRVLTKYDLCASFIQVIIFDALIANQDRHCDNWGVLVNRHGVHLAPIYDNGSSLGFQLTKDDVIKKLHDEEMFRAFTRRSRSIIGLRGKKRPKTLDLLTEIATRYPRECADAVERLEWITEPVVQQVLQLIPDQIMPEIYKVWVCKLVLYRKEWLQNWYVERK